MQECRHAATKRFRRITSAVEQVIAQAAQCEPLEVRRLLTFAVSGTPGPDLIEMFHDGTAYRFQVNGVSNGFTTDSSILVSALGGDDTIVPVNVQSGQKITILGGGGDDTVRVGTGHMHVHHNGQVFFKEMPGEGSDRVIVDDTLDNADTERDFTIAADSLEGLTHRFTSGLGSPPQSIHFDANVEAIDISTSSAHDTVHVLHGMPQGLTMSLAAGNDDVVYGGLFRVVPDMPPATIDGGAGFDDVIFDDADAPAGGRHYQGGTELFLNQRLPGFENMTLRPRPRAAGAENEVTFAGGLPVGDNILIDTDFGVDHVEQINIGTFSDRIDLDSQDLIFTLRNQGTVEFEDEDIDNTGAAFELYTIGSNIQRIDKGGFRLSFESTTPSALIFSHSADEYAVSRVLPNSQIRISGSLHDDSLYTANRNGVDNDLDAVFPFTSATDGRFHFSGNQGEDMLDLNDSADQTGDSDENYFLRNASFGEDNLFLKGINDSLSLRALLSFYTVDLLNLVGDADSNIMNVQDQVGTSVTLNGGLGNDTFTNYKSRGGHLDHDIWGGAFIGGPGNDNVALDDTEFGDINVAADEYAFLPSAFAYTNRFGNLMTFLYDSTLESFSLDQSNAVATTSLVGKLPGLRLSVSALGGNDTFSVGGGDIDRSGFSAATTTLLGGTGEDRIIFDDRADDHGVFDADTFTFSFQQVTKDGVALNYGGFESQKLITSGVNSSSLLFPNTVRLHGIDMPTEVVGTAGDRDNIVEMGHPTFGVSQVTFGTITLDFTAAPAVVNVTDVSTVGRTYRLTATQLLLPSVVNYSGVASLNIYAGGGADTLNVDALSASANAFFSGGNGDDLMSIGSGGPIAPIAGRVFVRGDAGDDEFFVTNGAGGGFTDATLVAGTISVNGGPAHLYDPTIERMHVIANDAGADFDVQSSIAPTTLHGAAGNDHVTIGAGNINATLTANLHVEGNGGQDSIIIDDTAAPNIGFISAAYAFDVDGPTERMIRSADTASGPNRIISSTGVEQRTLHCNEGGSGVTVYNTLNALRINTNGGNDGIFIHDGDVPVTLSTGAGMDYLQVGNYFGTDTPIVVFDQDDEVGGMSIRNTGTLLLVNDAALSDLGTLRGSLGEPVVSGVLDLGDGAMLMGTGQYALTAEQIRGLLIRGRNDGAWNGVNFQGLGAIHSTAAAASPIADGVGYGRGSQVGITQIGSFPIGPDDVLVRQTLDGDADLSGSVNIADFSRVATNFNGTNKVWTSGDFNYDNATNISDFASLAANFNQISFRSRFRSITTIEVELNIGLDELGSGH